MPTPTILSFSHYLLLFMHHLVCTPMLTQTQQDISISSLFLATKLNETPIRLRNLINTYIYLTARIRHLLSLPPDRPLPLPLPLPSPVPSQDTDLNGIIAGAGSSSTASVGGATVKGKERAREAVWEGMEFQVPGFHDEVFWECTFISSTSSLRLTRRYNCCAQILYGWQKYAVRWGQDKADSAIREKLMAFT